MNFKDKTALVFDTGIGIVHAERLAKDFKRVYLHTPWANGNPKYSDYCQGLGLPNIEKVLHPWEYMDKADLVVFLDIGWGDMADWLRKSGKAIFGAGEGETLEGERFKARQLQAKLGLPTQNTVEVNGVTGLREYLKEHKNKFVKLDVFRGVIESFPAKDLESVEMILDEIEAGFGPNKDNYQFMVEEAIPKAIEVGADTYFNGTDFVRPVMWGIEAGSPYIGKFSATLPKPLEDCLAKLTPVLRKMNYRGAFSIENRLVSKDKGYLVDLTSRYPYPLSSIFTEAIVNYSEVVWKVAHGEEVKASTIGPYVGALPLSSPHAKENWVRLFFDKKDAHRVKLITPTKVGENYYGVKGTQELFCLVAIGKSVNDVIAQLVETVDRVDAFELDKSPVATLYKIKDEIRELRRMGVDF